MKIVIFGSTGMLGTYCMKYFTQQKYEVMGIDRKMLDLTSDTKTIIDFLRTNIKKSDIIINAAGVIKQRFSPEENMVKVNSIFPHILSNFKIESGCEIFHITTDCVFSGKKGQYSELDEHDATDLYGISKSNGEPKNLSVIRTSIIGEELNNKLSLIEWCKSKKGENVKGYVDHFWNGVTCLNLAGYMNHLIINSFFHKGVKHYFSPNSTNKNNLLCMINKIYDLDMIISPMFAGKCDRTLINYKGYDTTKSTIEEQLLELKEFDIYV